VENLLTEREKLVQRLSTKKILQGEIAFSGRAARCGRLFARRFA